MKFRFVVLFIFTFSLPVSSQDRGESFKEKEWFVSLDYGVQMSGIKSEDFIDSNYSPLIKITGGKWLNKSFALQIGYQGWYFNAIADNDKHFYNFYFTEVVFNAKNILFTSASKDRFYDLLFHAGLGYFQNNYYGNSTIHGILGVGNNFSISKKIQLKLDVGAIVGWDIYQGDDDILPSLSIGTIYMF